MFDTSHLLVPRILGQRRWAGVGGAQRHGAALSGCHGRGPGRLEGHRGRPAARRRPPERAQLDRPLRSGRAAGPGGSFTPPAGLLTPDLRRARGAHLRAAPPAPRLGAAPHRASARQEGGRPAAVCFQHLSLSSLCSSRGRFTPRAGLRTRPGSQGTSRLQNRSIGLAELRDHAGGRAASFLPLTRTARSSHRLAPSPSKISRASTKCGRASSSRPSATSHSLCSSRVTAR
jgi:hypothetical protein